MQVDDLAKFGEIMFGLAENFSVEVSEVGIKMRFEALKQFPIEEVEKAAIRILQDRQYTTLPTVADFVNNLGGRVADIAATEARKVIAALRRHGSYTSIVFDDPTTQAVIAQGFGGWAKLGVESLEDDEKWFIRDFEKLYASYKRQGIETYGKLAGSHEIINASKGLLVDHVPAPVLIGNPEKAQLVLVSTHKNVDMLGSGRLGELTKQIGNDKND